MTEIPEIVTDYPQIVTDYPQIVTDYPQIVTDYPPLIDEIDVAFGVRGRHGIIYAWGNRIYNPSSVFVPPQLVVHEVVHCIRQGVDITGWWRRYIDEPAFRLAEEIPAHQAEYQWLLEYAPRRERRQALQVVAARLAGKLYGGLVTPKRAKELLRAAA
jgi:hypothetical protein